MCGDTRDLETAQDRNMILQVREAPDNHNDILIIYVSMPPAVVTRGLPVADHRYRVPEYYSMQALVCFDFTAVI